MDVETVAPVAVRALPNGRRLVIPISTAPFADHG